jgi:hypothetical protein
VPLALVREADLAANLLSPGHTKLLRDAPGYRERGDSPRLRAAHLPLQTKSSFKTHLRDLRGLTGAGLSRDDDNLMRSDSLYDLSALLRNRKSLRIGDLKWRAGDRLSSRLIHRNANV